MIDTIIADFEKLAGVTLHDHVRAALYAAIEGNIGTPDCPKENTYDQTEDAPSDEGTEED